MKFFKPRHSVCDEWSATDGLEEGEKFLDNEDTASLSRYSQSPNQDVRSLSSRTIAGIAFLTIANLLILGVSVAANSRCRANLPDKKSAIRETSAYCKLLLPFPREVSISGTLKAE